MKPNARSNQLRNRAALARTASHTAITATERNNLLTKAKGLEILATAEEWLDDTPAVPAGRSRAR